MFQRNQQDNDGGDDDSKTSKRRSFLGLAAPLALAVAANGPTIGVILFPPSSEQREEMLVEWCQSDYCTLLQGGAGYSTNGGGNGGSYNPDLVLPTAEEYTAEQTKLAQAEEDDCID